MKRVYEMKNGKEREREKNVLPPEKKSGRGRRNEWKEEVTRKSSNIDDSHNDDSHERTMKTE